MRADEWDRLNIRRSRRRIPSYPTDVYAICTETETAGAFAVVLFAKLTIKPLTSRGTRRCSRALFKKPG